VSVRTPPADLEAAYAALRNVFVDDERVTAPSPTRGKFGTNGYKVNGKFFAMWAQGALVVKLPESEVDKAVAEGRGAPFTMGAGRVMRAWLVVHAPTSQWASISKRARDFVAGTL
jgi:hypothetical protein